jgi:biotin carboxyl carrier protein
VPSGWRNNRSSLTQASFLASGSTVTVGYHVTGPRVLVEIDGEARGDGVLRSCTANTVDLEFGGVRRSYDVLRAGNRVHVHSSLGSSSLAAVPRFPDPEIVAAAGSLAAPMPGMVQRVLVEPGATVAAGAPLVVLEAMKMEHTVASPADGRVASVLVTVGQQVEAGAALVVIDDGDAPPIG